MPVIHEITDLTAPELDIYARLTQAQLRNRLEPEKGIFIAESPKVIARALDAGYQPLSLLMERKQINGPAQEILTRCGDVPVYTADRELLAQLTGFALTRGVLCAFRRPAPRTVEQVCAHARRVAVLEGIVDSTNVGAIFRSAAALNMDAVLVTPSCCDPLCRRAVRVSMGTVFQVPWAQIGTCPADWPENGSAQLHALGFKSKKRIKAFGEWVEDHLRRACGALSPDKRIIVILTLLLFFSVLSLYFTVSSIYRFGKGAGERMQIRHIERLELELRQRQEADSVKHLKDFNYDDERKTE